MAIRMTEILNNFSLDRKILMLNIFHQRRQILVGKFWSRFSAKLLIEQVTHGSLAQPQACLAYPQACLAQAQACLAQPQAWLAGWLLGLPGCPPTYLTGIQAGLAGCWAYKGTKIDFADRFLPDLIIDCLLQIICCRLFASCLQVIYRLFAFRNLYLNFSITSMLFLLKTRNGPMDHRPGTNGLTDPHIEMRGCIKKQGHCHKLRALVKLNV